MYEWSELIKLWEHDQVTATQVIGQLLKHGEAQQALMTALHRRVEQMEQVVISRQGTLPPAPPPGKSTSLRR